MSRTPNKAIMNYDSMVEQQEGIKKTRTYKTESAELSSSTISQSVTKALIELKQSDTMEKIRLDDTDAVKAVTEQYLMACAQTATLPTMSGLCRCLGYSWSGVRWHMAHKPASPTTDWLQRFHDICSDVLSQNALKGSVHPIVSIFLQKALYGLRDTVTIESVPVDDEIYGDAPKAIDYVKKYGHLIDQETEG